MEGRLCRDHNDVLSRALRQGLDACQRRLQRTGEAFARS